VNELPEKGFSLYFMCMCTSYPLNDIIIFEIYASCLNNIAFAAVTISLPNFTFSLISVRSFAYQHRVSLATVLASVVKPVRLIGLHVTTHLRGFGCVNFLLSGSLSHWLHFLCRTVLDYYSSASGDADEDAYDMRKPLSRDVHKVSIVAEKTEITPDELH